MNDRPTDTDAGKLVDAQADRPATPEEAAAAADARRNVDLDAVAAHETEMNRMGANIKGEGEIEPSDS